MNSLESITGWIVKLIFILLLLPFAVSFLSQLLTTLWQGFAAMFVAALPWVVGLLLLIALVAGVSAGITMRRYFPPHDDEGGLPGFTAVKRPRGLREDDRA